MSNTQLPALLAAKETAAYSGLAYSSLYQLVADGEFPNPRKIGKRSRWVRAEIDQWIAGLEVAL